MTSIVGLLSDVLPSGGVQRASRHVAAVSAKFAADRNMTVRFLSMNDPQGLHTVRVGALEFAVSGYAGSKAQFVLAAMRAARRKPMLVIALHPHLAPIAWAMKASARNLRSMVFAHGIEVWHPLRWPRGPALRRADLVVCPSRDTVQRLISAQGVREDKIRRLPWGLDPDFEGRLAARDRLLPPPGFPQGKRIILSLGRWDKAEQYKGADTLIMALPQVLRAMPDVSLVLVGDGNDRPRLEQLARDRGIVERTQFLHGLTAEQLSGCYANCDVFALPSRGEGFGLVFLEAMAHSKPVVGGAHAGIPDIVEDGVTGLLVPYGDAGRLGQALESLLSHADEARQMGERGRERVLEEFSFGRFQSGLEELLRDVSF
jgi:phosphatidyl-myo-inositol dimannoside synthase